MSEVVAPVGLSELPTLSVGLRRYGSHMDYSSLRGQPLHYVHQELKASVPGVAEQIPPAVLAAVTRLSGGYKHLAKSSYVERSEDDEFFVYWTDGAVLGAVYGSSDDWTARPPQAVRITGQVIPVAQLSGLEFAETPDLRYDDFDAASVSFRDRLRFAFSDGTKWVVPRFDPQDQHQRAGLDQFIEACLASVRVAE